MMTSRERVIAALAHEEADRVPVDLGASPVTGMHVSVVYGLRQALGLDAPGTPVKVVEPYQMLGEIKPDLMDSLGIDVIGLSSPKTMFGFRNEGWKPWTTFGGTPVLVPEGFNTDVEENGDLFLYAEGDKSYPPAGRMPAGGWYFDSTRRQYPIDDDNLNVEDNLEEFGLVSDEDLAYYAETSKQIYEQTDKAILANFGGTGFGDIALVPGPWLKDPKGIRDVEEWYISTVARKDYVKAIFEAQCEIGLQNLARIYEAVGDRITVVMVTGTDFGTQRGPFISNRTYRSLYKPYHIRINTWIHENTPWKTFIHSCGSIVKLIPEFIEAGFDILNPVQCSAADMAPEVLKERFGKDVTFWGGGVDTQKTLPFGTADEVRAEIRERVQIFAPGGGFVFNTIHNVQPLSPVENMLAVYEAVREAGAYPITVAGL